MKIAKAITQFIQEKGGSGMEVPAAIMEEYLSSCRRALEEVFKDSPRFPRASNLGQEPLLLWCRKNYPEAKEDIAPRMRTTFWSGKVHEAYVVAMMQMAGLATSADFQVRGSFTIDGVPDPITGTCDLLLNQEEVRDIKTCHDIAYQEKWTDAQTLAENDDFNYLNQAHAYQRMLKKPFTGWLVINKNNGEMKDVLLEDDYLINNPDMVEAMEEDLRIAYEKERPELPPAEPELYKGEPTGNLRVPSRWCRTPYVPYLWPEAIPARRGEQKIWYLPPFNGIKVPGIKLIEKK